MKVLITSLLADLATLLLFPVLAVANFFWQRHKDKALSEAAKAANCADYLNTEYGTQYTAEEVETIYRGIWTEWKRRERYMWN
jgi:hypothetical protein